MIARLATSADAARILQYRRDLLGRQKGVTLAKVRQRMAASNIITSISEHGYCEIKTSEKEAQVTMLLPQGTSISLLRPALQEAMNETVRRFSPDLRLWAAFWQPVDENGKPDEGKSECEAWRREYPATRVLWEDGRWIIESRIGDIAWA